MSETPPDDAHLPADGDDRLHPLRFQDHFSERAEGYAAFRPDYPRELFAWIAGNAPARDLVLDVGTGNGQAAVSLARHFDRVIAIDASAAQIARAEHHERVAYAVADATEAPVADRSCSAITVAQALHWFDADSFGASVERVLAPGGVLAVWCYARCRVEERIDRIVEHLYSNLLGTTWWPPERRLVERGYDSVPLPGTPLRTPLLEMTQRFTLARFLGYLRTWSAVGARARATGEDPVLLIEEDLRAAWGDEDVARTVEWALALRATRVG